MNTIASIWLEKDAQIFVLGHYLFLKAHSFLELRLRKTVCVSEQIMSADIYPSMFPRQMEAIVYCIIQTVCVFLFLQSGLELCIQTYTCLLTVFNVSRCCRCGFHQSCARKSTLAVTPIKLRTTIIFMSLHFLGLVVTLLETDTQSLSSLRILRCQQIRKYDQMLIHEQNIVRTSRYFNTIRYDLIFLMLSCNTTSLYCGQFAWFQRKQNSYYLYLLITDSSKL